MRCFGYFFCAAAILLPAMPSYAFNAGIGAEGGVAAGGYGARVGFEVGTDTSSGLIKYDLSIEIGKATGKGIDLSTDLVKLGTGDYIPEKGGGFKFVGEIPLGKNASFSGTVKSDGTYEGSIEVVTPKGLKVSFDVDSSGKITAGAGAKISAGEFTVNGGVLTYHISGVLYDPDAPVESYGDAVLKGLGDAWTAPGQAVAKTQIALQEMGKKIQGIWNNFKKDPLKHPLVQYYKEHYANITAPKVAFVNIDDYCMTRDLLGIKKNEKGPFVILTEDYTYRDLDGTERTIPAGFIFDGASVPNWTRFFVQGTPLDPTLLVPGLIHDYMYRCGVYEYNKEILNGGMDLKAYADMMLYVNSYIAGNQNPSAIYAGVTIEVPIFNDAGDAFDWHIHHEKEYYQTFTPEYYKHNLDVLEKYRDRWTKGQDGQLFGRAGVSIDNEECIECKIGGKDPGIVDNRPGFGGGSGGNGGAGTGSGGGGGGGDESGSGNGTGGGTGSGTEGGTDPGDGTSPGDGSPGVTVPLPDVVLPNGDGTLPWDNIVGFTIPYNRALFLLSGDLPDDEDFHGAWTGLVDMFKENLDWENFDFSNVWSSWMERIGTLNLEDESNAIEQPGKAR